MARESPGELPLEAHTLARYYAGYHEATPLRVEVAQRACLAALLSVP
jgi:hypothetical protein